LRPSLGTVENLVPIDASPPNLRDEMCGGKHKRPASDEDEDAVASNASGPSTGETAITFFTAGLQPPMAKPSDLLAAEAAPSEPIPVYTGPTKTGPALIAAVAIDTENQTPPHRGKKSRVAAKKPGTAAEPAAAKHANAKPDGAEKPVAATAKPAKPKAAAKPKPAPKSTTSEANPADQKTATAPHT
jgi:D-alanyl-D-alanine carboxypeptidase